MKRFRQHVFSILRMALGLGVLVYLGRSGILDGSALAGLLQQWPIALASLACMGAATCVVSWRLCLLLHPHTLRLDFLTSLKLALIGLFFNTCLPGATGGDLVRVYYTTKDNPGRRIEIVTLLVLDRITGMLGLLILPLLLMPFFVPVLASQPILQALVWAPALGLVAILSGLAVAMSERVGRSKVVGWLSHKVPQGQYLERVLATLRAVRTHSRSLGIAISLSLVTHMLLTLGTLLVVQATSPDGVKGLMALLIPFGFVANALPLTPGGLGVGEAAFDQLFQLGGFTGGAVALLGWRVMMFVLGLPGLGFYLFAKQQAVAPQLSTPSLS